MTLRLAWIVLAEILSKWNEHKVIHLAAALAYYGIFAIAPVLMIVIAGLMYGRVHLKAILSAQSVRWSGGSTTLFIRELVDSAGKPRVGWITVVVGVVGIIFSSASFFFHMTHP